MPRFYYRLRVRPQMPVQPAGGGTVLLRQAWKTVALYEQPETALAGLKARLQLMAGAREKAIVSYKGRQVFPFNPPQRATDVRCDACRTFPKTDGLTVWCHCAEGRDQL